MRTLTLAVFVSAVATTAYAQQPVDPDGNVVETAPAPPAVVVQPQPVQAPAQPDYPAQPVYPAQPAYPAQAAPQSYPTYPPPAPPAYAPRQGPIDPYSTYPTYPAPRYAPPRVYQNGYYLYPAQPQYPVYYSPQLRCPANCNNGYGWAQQRRPAARITAAGERIRRFSLGVHGSVIGLNQTVGGNNVILYGGGIQLRIRSMGRFGLELAQSVLQTENYWNGNWQRTSFPFTFGLMLYVFPNQDSRHFNLYGIAGVGAMLDSVSLRDENRQKVSQEFLEWIAYVGAGAELRFKWFAIAGDFRFNGFWRDDSSAPAAYYKGVPGGPVPANSMGYQGKLNINFWF